MTAFFWQTRHVLLNFGSVSFQFRILSTYSQWNWRPRCSNKGLTFCNIILSQYSAKRKQFLSISRSGSRGKIQWQLSTMTAWTCWFCRCKQVSWQHPLEFACQVKLTGLWQIVFQSKRLVYENYFGNTNEKKQASSTCCRRCLWQTWKAFRRMRPGPHVYDPWSSVLPKWCGRSWEKSGPMPSWKSIRSSSPSVAMMTLKAFPKRK